MTKQQQFLLLVVLIIAGASVTYYYTQNEPSTSEKQTAQEQVNTSPKATTSLPVTPTAQAPQVKDTPVSSPSIKSYSSDVTYSTPEESKETIHVTIEMLGDTISNITFKYDTPHKRESKEYLGSFEKALPAMALKGKKLSEVSLSRVGGASLTTNAFMEAVGKIRSQANG